jgi:hypothetical protein
MKKHELPVCMAVWYNGIIDGDFDIEEICQQGYADLRLGGINEAVARRVRSRYGSDFLVRKGRKSS